MTVGEIAGLFFSLVFGLLSCYFYFRGKDREKREGVDWDNVYGMASRGMEVLRDQLKLPATGGPSRPIYGCIQRAYGAFEDVIGTCHTRLHLIQSRLLYLAESKAHEQLADALRKFERVEEIVLLDDSPEAAKDEARDSALQAAKSALESMADIVSLGHHAIPAPLMRRYAAAHELAKRSIGKATDTEE